MPKATDVPVAPPEQLAPLPSMPPPVQPGETPSIAQLQAQLAAAQAAQNQAFIQQAAPVQPQTAVPTPPQTPVLPPTTAPPVQAAPQPMAPMTMPPLVQPVSPAPTVMPTQPPVVPQVHPHTHPQPQYTPPPGAPPVVPQMAPAPAPAVVPQTAPAISGLAAQMEAMGAASGGGSGIDILRQFDLAGVETNNFRLLPLDIPVYEGTITKAELTKSTTGFPQIKLTVKTCYPSMHAGVSINDYVTIQPNTMWKYKSLLQATGLLSPDGARFAGSSMQDFLGKIVQFQVKHDPYDGELRNKINGGYSVGTLSEQLQQPAVPTGAGAGIPPVAWAPPTG